VEWSDEAFAVARRRDVPILGLLRSPTSPTGPVRPHPGGALEIAYELQRRGWLGRLRAMNA
jgi:hypothetical protein